MTVKQLQEKAQRELAEVSDQVSQAEYGDPSCVALGGSVNTGGSLPKESR